VGFIHEKGCVLAIPREISDRERSERIRWKLLVSNI
jgi:hypothetical protein